MGKALIVSGGEDGLYTITPLHNRARIEAEITRLEELLTQLNERLVELEVDLLVAEVDVLNARDALNAIINAAAAEGEIPESNALRAATANLLEASKVRDLLKIDRDMEKARVLETQAELRALGAIPLDQDQESWCADLTEDLTGEVATAEIPGEGRSRIIIMPGYEGGAAHQPSRDGQLFHRAGQSPAQVYFNAAILPGWQKWMPTYRVGTVTAKVGDSLTIVLDDETSSARGLSINQSNDLIDVPAEYMECNSGAFQTEDRVLVKFNNQDWSQPVVIGFESNPRACSPLWAAYWNNQPPDPEGAYILKLKGSSWEPVATIAPLGLGWSGTEIAFLPAGSFVYVEGVSGGGFQLVDAVGSAVYTFANNVYPTGLTIDPSYIYVVATDFSGGDGEAKIFRFSHSGGGSVGSPNISDIGTYSTRECFCAISNGILFAAVRDFTKDQIEVAAFNPANGSKIFSCATFGPQTSMTGGWAYNGVLAFAHNAPGGEGTLYVQNFTGAGVVSVVSSDFAWCDRFMYLTIRPMDLSKEPPIDPMDLVFHEDCLNTRRFPLPIAANEGGAFPMSQGSTVPRPINDRFVIGLYSLTDQFWIP